MLSKTQKKTNNNDKSCYLLYKGMHMLQVLRITQVNLIFWIANLRNVIVKKRINYKNISLCKITKKKQRWNYCWQWYISWNYTWFSVNWLGCWKWIAILGICFVLFFCVCFVLVCLLRGKKNETKIIEVIEYTYKNSKKQKKRLEEIHLALNGENKDFLGLKEGWIYLIWKKR